jgi:ribonucleoside-diphosphate reductase alpha chain
MTKCGVSSLYVIKRDGRSEPLNFAKVEKVVKYAAEGLNIDISEFFNEFQFLFRNGITTKELQTNLINTANKMVYRKGQIRPEYSILANRLFLMDFWKEIRLQRETQFASSQSDDDQ